LPIFGSLPRSVRVMERLAEILIIASELQGELAETPLAPVLQLIRDEAESSLRRLAS
jgi:hypothetical protein